MAALELVNTDFFTDGNLVHYWKLENTSDSKGSATLTNNGSIAFEAALYNNGAQFGDPNTTKWFSHDGLHIATGTDMTICYWYKGAKATFSFFSDIGGGGADEWYLFGSDGGAVTYHSCNSDGSEQDIGGGTASGYDNVAWHHIAFVARDSGSDWIATSYMDGVQVGTGTIVGKNIGKMGDLTIGKIILEGSHKSLGLMDDVAIFSRALTADEISILANGERAGIANNFIGTGFW